MAVAVLFTASCAKEDISSSIGGGEVEVTFTANLQDLGSRAYGDGSQVNTLRYYVYDYSSNNELRDLNGTASRKENGQFEFSLPLLKGMKYNIVFWADCSTGSIYSYNPIAKTITANYNGVLANNESLDAFYKCVTEIDPTNATTLEDKTNIVLTRPFAQLNILTKDYAAIENNGVALEKSKIAGVIPTTLNVLDGTIVTPTEEVTLVFNNLPTDENTNDDLTPLSMNYILAPATQKFVADITVSYEGSIPFPNATYTNIPLQRNYKTNIIGNLLTASTDFTVTIDANFGTPDETVATDTLSLQEAINNAKDGVSTVISICNDINLNENSNLGTLSTRAVATYGVVIPASKVIVFDIKGARLHQSKKQTAAYSMIQNNGNLTIKGNGTISYADTGVGGNYASNTIGNSGTLVVEGCTIENNSSADVAANGYPHVIDNSANLTITGGTLTNNTNYSTIRIWCTTDDNTAVTINGGTFNGCIDFQTPNASANKGTLTITGGTFNADTYTNCATRLLGFGSDVDEMVANISGGTFNGAITLKKFVSGEFNSKVYSITGGTFAADPSEFVAPGYAAVENNGSWKVEEKGWYVDDKGNYHIEGVKGWLWMSDQNDTFFRNKTIYLENDIDFTGIDIKVARMFTPEYYATFDGQNHTISNVYMASNYTSNNQALFDGLMNVKNLNVNNAQVYGQTAVGIIGANIFGTIENCHVKNSRAYGYVWQVGGIVGLHSWGEIKNCSVENTKIECYYYGAVGAIAGCMNEMSRNITNCSVKNCQLIKEGTGYPDYDPLFGIIVGAIYASGNFTFSCEIENNTINGTPSETVYGGTIPAGSTVTFNGVQL